MRIFRFNSVFGQFLEIFFLGIRKCPPKGGMLASNGIEVQSEQNLLNSPKANRRKLLLNKPIVQHLSTQNPFPICLRTKRTKCIQNRQLCCGNGILNKKADFQIIDLLFALFPGLGGTNGCVLSAQKKDVHSPFIFLPKRSLSLLQYGHSPPANSQNRPHPEARLGLLYYRKSPARNTAVPVRHTPVNA